MSMQLGSPPVSATPRHASNSPASLQQPPASTASLAARPLRVSQVDSLELDDALSSMLAEDVSASLDNFNPHLKVQLQPELLLLISMMLYKFGVWDRLVSPGAQLQNLKLTAHRWGADASRARLRNLLLLHFFLSPQLFPRWLFERFRRFALSRSWPDLPRRSWRKRLWHAVGKIEDFGRASELVGLVWFLWDGQYPSLLNRVLGLKLVPSSSMLTRMVSFEFMNRQLVWSSMATFLPHVAPHLPIVLAPLVTARRALAQSIALLTDQPPDYHALAQAAAATTAKDGTSLPAPEPRGPYAGLPKSTCPVCYSKSAPASSSAVTIPQFPSIPALPPAAGAKAVEPPADDPNSIHIPVRADCFGQCEYCYFCLGEALVRTEEAERLGALEGGGGRGVGAAGGGWPCLRCGGSVRAMTMVES